MSDAPLAFPMVADFPEEPAPAPPDQFTDLIACPECGKQCKGTTGLGVHRSTIHGVAPKHKSYKKKKTRAIAVATEAVLDSMARERKPKAPPKPDWSTREVFDSVVSLLWPGDTMPVAALPILLDWREDTERMLRRLEELP